LPTPPESHSSWLLWRRSIWANLGPNYRIYYAAQRAQKTPPRPKATRHGVADNTQVGRHCGYIHHRPGNGHPSCLGLQAWPHRDARLETQSTSHSQSSDTGTLPGFVFFRAGETHTPTGDGAVILFFFRSGDGAVIRTED